MGSSPSGLGFVPQTCSSQLVAGGKEGTLGGSHKAITIEPLPPRTSWGLVTREPSSASGHLKDPQAGPTPLKAAPSCKASEHDGRLQPVRDQACDLGPFKSSGLPNRRAHSSDHHRLPAVATRGLGGGGGGSWSQRGGNGRSENLTEPGSSLEESRPEVSRVSGLAGPLLPGPSACTPTPHARAPRPSWEKVPGGAGGQFA